MISKKRYLFIFFLLCSLLYFIRIPIFIFGCSIKDNLTFDKPVFDGEIISGLNFNLEQENNSLKEIINFKKENYNSISAFVISRDNPWQSSFTIDKGKNDGVDVNMSVIGNYGLIGKIKKVYDNYSVVELITSNKLKIGVTIIDSSEIYGIIDYYDSSDNSFVVSSIIKDSIINIGDKVYTNGIGGVYPDNIYVGDVYSVSDDNLNLSKLVRIKIKDNLFNIKYVNVLGR